MNKIVFIPETVFGSIEIVTDTKFEDGKIWMGGHSVHRDRNGVVVKTTEPEFYCYCSFERYVAPSSWAKRILGRMFR